MISEKALNALCDLPLMSFEDKIQLAQNAIGHLHTQTRNQEEYAEFADLVSQAEALLMKIRDSYYTSYPDK
jgi:hypothetical protein